MAEEVYRSRFQLSQLLPLTLRLIGKYWIDRFQWITAIECVSTIGIAILPLIIFKAKHTNTAWIPQDTLSDWRFSTSDSGWTSNSYTYKAPLDVSVFSPLKRALATETDAALRLDLGCILQIEWTSMYIRVRETALRPSNILSSFKATMLEKLPALQALQASEPYIITPLRSLDLLLLQSDPLDSTELREANALLLEIAREAEKVIADKSAHTRKRKRPAAAEIEEQEDELLKNVSSDSELDCIVVQSHRLQ
ncbi:hypothetical protein M433DRAFT_159585 [Acidomyces richmondensis BFW]|nr:hypothetical protein M433DRAFT_159585 [Acidomyces richmondensis BFW]